MPTSYPDSPDAYLGPNDYANYINGLSNLPKPVGDEQTAFDMTRNGKALLADQDMHNFIQTDPDVEAQTPLEQLIPKVASRTATKEEYMRFYKLMGQDL